MNPNYVGKEIHSVGNLIKKQVDNLSSIRYADQLTGTNGWIIAYLYHHQGQDILIVGVFLVVFGAFLFVLNNLNLLTKSFHHKSNDKWF